MYKSLCHRKCTVAAVHNLSVQVLLAIGNVYMGKFLGGHISCLFTAGLKQFYFYDSNT